MKRVETKEQAEQECANLCEILRKGVGGNWYPVITFTGYEWQYCAMLGTMSIYPNPQGKYNCYLNTVEHPGRMPAYFHNGVVSTDPCEAVIRTIQYAYDFANVTKNLVDQNSELLNKSLQIIDCTDTVYQLEDELGHELGLVRIKRTKGNLYQTIESFHDLLTEQWYNFIILEEGDEGMSCTDVNDFCQWFNGKCRIAEIERVELIRTTPS